METPSTTPSTTPTPEPVPAPAKKSNTGLIIGIVVVVLLCCCCVAAIVGYYAYTMYSAQLLKGTGMLFNLF